MGKLIVNNLSNPEMILERLEELKDSEAIGWMEKYGITPENAFGIKIPILRKLAKEIGTDHKLALDLWDLNYRETRILASMIDDPDFVTESQMERWASDFDYWEICDQCIMSLFERTKYAYQKVIDWTKREEEYVKRAGYVLIARLAVSDKKADDDVFISFLPLIQKGASDPRNMVKKSVNWALRQIGKRNRDLNKEAIMISNEILHMDFPSAKWVAKDALKELESELVQNRLKRIK